MGARQDLGIGIGFAGGTMLATIDQLRADARWAADAGFDSYWVSYLAGVDPFVALAVAAADTGDRIELGTSVVPIAGRHPLAMAQLARTTQQACRGRFTLGVGPSHQPVVESRYGETWGAPLERTREYLSALVPLCNGEAAAMAGNQIACDAALDIPCDPIPVVLAALGPRMLDLAGRTTSGTHVGQCGPHTIASHTAPRITEAAKTAGRPDPRIIALVNLCVTDDPVGVRAAAAEGAAFYSALPSYRAMLDLEGITDPTDLILAGSIGQIVEGLALYAEAGVTDLRLGLATPDHAHNRATRDALADWLA